MLPNLKRSHFFFSKKFKSTFVIQKLYKYELEFALRILRAFDIYHYPQTYSLEVYLGTNAKKSEQNVRGICILPEGTGKTKKIAFFSQNKKLQEIARKHEIEIVTED